MILRLAPKFLMVFLMLSVSGLFMACSDDEQSSASANDDLQGDWTATSFVVLGNETLGFTNTSLTLTFTATVQNPNTNTNTMNMTTNITSNNTGTMQGTIVDLNGGSNATAFSYTVLNDGSRIRIGSDTLDMVVSGNNLNLEGGLFGFESIVVANQ